MADAKQKYNRAANLHKQGRNDEALAILDELDREFPRNKEIMYARALSLEALGKGELAIPICAELMATYADTRFQDLMGRLSESTLRRTEDPSSTPKKTDIPRPLVLLGIACGGGLVIAVVLRIVVALSGGSVNLVQNLSVILAIGAIVVVVILLPVAIVARVIRSKHSVPPNLTK